MLITNSYKAKIINKNLSLKPTLVIYRNAVSFLVDVYNKEWHSINLIINKNDKFNYAEHLVHSTKDNIAKYDFDSKFYKFPSYLRRSAITDALGIVSSYKSNLENYEQERYEAISNGKQFKKKAPKLQLNHFKCPAFYKGNMYEQLDRLTAKIKTYNGSDWVWTTIKLRNQDIKYIESNKKGKEFSPILEQRGKAFYLRFAFQNKETLKNTPLKEQKVLAVDLGLNHSAVCCLMSYDGTVTKRFFINQAVEKDHQNHLLNRLRLKQKQGGKYSKNSKLWAKINNLNEEIVNKTVNQIVYLAYKNNVDVIVFEHLEFKGKKPKYIAQRLQMWAKRTIQKKVEHKAHTFKIRVNRVNAKNTSKLAFDGSGKVIRDNGNYSSCTFTTGKQYNCDLNASYNIGARYFIKEINKAISVKKWSDVVAKVPQLQRRTQCTLSTLISLVAVL